MWFQTFAFNSKVIHLTKFNSYLNRTNPEFLNPKVWYDKLLLTWYWAWAVVVTVLLSAVVSAISDLVGWHGAEYWGLETGCHLLPAPDPLHRPYQLQVSVVLMCYAVWLLCNFACECVCNVIPSWFHSNGKSEFDLPLLRGIQMYTQSVICVCILCKKPSQVNVIHGEFSLMHFFHILFSQSTLNTTSHWH